MKKINKKEGKKAGGSNDKEKQGDQCRDLSSRDNGIELYDPDQLCCRYFHVPGQQGDKDDENSRIRYPTVPWVSVRLY